MLSLIKNIIMKVGEYIFNKCREALNNGAEVLCAEIKIRYRADSMSNSQPNIKAELKVGHSKAKFERWLEELDVNYVEEIFNICDPFTQNVSGTIWFNDGTWLCGYIDHTGHKRWVYSRPPEIPANLL